MYKLFCRYRFSLCAGHRARLHCPDCFGIGMWLSSGQWNWNEVLEIWHTASKKYVCRFLLSLPFRPLVTENKRFGEMGEAQYGKSLGPCWFVNFGVPLVKFEIVSHTEGKERQKKEAAHCRLVGGSFNTQRNLHMRLVLGNRKMSRSLHLPTRSLIVYTEALTGLSPVQCRWPHKHLTLSRLYPGNNS